MTDEQRQAVYEAHDTGPNVVVDPATETSYAMLRADLDDRYRAIFAEEFDVREACAAMDGVAAKEGWNDPSMDA